MAKKSKNIKTKNSKISKEKKSKSSGSKIDRILAMENTILDEEKSVEQKEDQIKNEEVMLEGQEKLLEKIETNVEQSEEREATELQKLEQLEDDIKKEVGEHPLANITFKDVVKGLIGAFIGLSVHYTFTYGVEISERLTVGRASVLYVLAFIVGLLFIYATGFRKIKDPKILMFMPVRLIVLYIASVLMSILILFIFYPGFGIDPVASYKQVGGVLLAAVIGACTADLIGKE